MSKQDREDWLKAKDLEDAGFELKPPAIRLHGSNETPKHAVIKTLLAQELQRRGRRWDTEVKCPDGRVDVLDLGHPDEKGVVYEVETGASPRQIWNKIKQYDTDQLRDVIVLDPTEAPDDVHEMAEWVNEQVLG